MTDTLPNTDEKSIRNFKWMNHIPLLTSFIYVASVFLGYFNLRIHYQYYDIQIGNYLTISEILLMFIVFFEKAFLGVILTSIYVVVDFISSGKKKFSFWTLFLPSIYTILGLIVSFKSNSLIVEQNIDYARYYYLLFVGIFLLLYKVIEHFESRSIFSYIQYAIVGFIFVVISTINKDGEINYYKNMNGLELDKIEIYYKNGKIEKSVFNESIGETENYLFLYDYVDKNSRIIRKDEIREILIKSNPSKTAIKGGIFSKRK